ncbi:MAG: NAD(P)-dependent oxidoreductase [Tatlockia sp.]|nr:NAD(P)-dependent oxidoreductase [Tatlockia sp.]
MKLSGLSQDLNYILEKTSSLWDELREQQIFISGGTGFFGCWLLESFLWVNKILNLDAKATILTRNIDCFASKYPHLYHQQALSFCEGDIKDFEFPKQKFSHIIHAATDTNSRVANNHSLALFDDIFKGTSRMLELAKHCRAKKFLLTSSGAVYGKQPEGLNHISETYLPQLQLFTNQSSYALGKCAAEHLCYLNSLESGFEVKIARCFSFVGPYLALDGPYALANFIGDGLKGQAIEIKGDGTPIRSYLYAADLMIWLWTILFRGQTAHPYNVGSDDAYSIKELADLVQLSFDSTLTVILKQKAQSNRPIERYVPNIDRARKDLNLIPQIKLFEAITLTKNWHLNQIVQTTNSS